MFGVAYTYKTFQKTVNSFRCNGWIHIYFKRRSIVSNNMEKQNLNDNEFYSK